MNFKIYLFCSIFLWHQSVGDQISTKTAVDGADQDVQDEIELYRQIFLRLNTIIKSNIELKVDILDLKEEIKQAMENRGNAIVPVPATSPKAEVTLPTCSNAAKSSPANGDFNNVYCFGDNWMVIQRRMDGSEAFDLSWNEYKNGFGNISGEFFIGLEKLYALTLTKPHELLIVLKDFDNDVRYAKYDNFQIGSEHEEYSLKQLGHYVGNAGDSLSYHINGKFSTKDRDNDVHPTISCSQKFGGGWWYQACHHSNLNGHYVHTDHDRSYASGIHWKTFRNSWYSLKYAQMMIRPKSG